MTELLTPKTVAIMADMHPQTIWRYIRTGQLRATKADGYRITVEDTMDFLRRLPQLSKSGRKKKATKANSLATRKPEKANNRASRR
jgi:hypothetical protein